MHQHVPSPTADELTISFTTYSAPSSTADVFDDATPIFLQTAGAKAIAGVFAFASILVTCIQVG